MYRVTGNPIDFASRLGKVVKKIIKATNEAIKQTAELIHADMQESGKPVSYPINWDSEKQRRFVMAKLSKENNLPYKRTGVTQNSWKIAEFKQGYTVSNKHPAGAINGTFSTQFNPSSPSTATAWQSNIHKGRWKKFPEVSAKRISELPKRILKNIKVDTK